MLCKQAKLKEFILTVFIEKPKYDHYIKESAFNKYDIDNMNITAIMFQTGYLTIKKVDRSEGTYLLDYLNKEVRDSFLDFAVENYANSLTDEMTYIAETLTESLDNKDIKSFFTALQSLFSSITVKQVEKVKEYEGFYHLYSLKNSRYTNTLRDPIKLWYHRCRN
jgi:hypothetical protein